MTRAEAAPADEGLQIRASHSRREAVGSQVAAGHQARGVVLAKAKMASDIADRQPLVSHKLKR